MKNSLSAALGGVTLSLAAMTVSGSTFTLSPTADAFVTTGSAGALANNNYGAAGSLSIAGASRPQGEFQSAMQFNLGPAISAFNAEFGAGNWNFQSVTLQMTATSASNPLFNVPAAGAFGISWQQNDAWIEGAGMPNSPSATGLNYNTLQSTFTGAGDERLGAFSFSGATSGSSVYTLNLTPGFESDLAAGGAVSLRFSPDDGGVTAIFNSRTFSGATARPILSVQAVPEPGILSLAVLGLAFVARRQK